ncbi:MAG: delta-60 repeat domain-containing protein, partial [Actinomycetota bacterium]
MLLAALPPLAARAAPADLDPGFGIGGKVTTPIGSDDDSASALALQGDGKIVAVGISHNGSDFAFAVVRYNPNGSLDAGFGSGGKVTTDIGSGDDFAEAVAVASDGKILVAGESDNGPNSDFSLVRFNPDGSLDTTFDTDGKVLTDFQGGDDGALGMAIQSDGKIVAAGDSFQDQDSDFALARYNSDGSLDPSFGGDGKVTTDIGSDDDSAFGVALQGDGKIVAAGSSFDVALGTFDFALARYNQNGSLDPTFAGDGTATTAVGSGFDEAAYVAVQADGRIVAAGESASGTSSDFALARYRPDGTLDPSFGGDGTVVTSISPGDDGAFGVALAPSGKIVAAGDAFGVENFDFALARYNPDGALDTTFAGDGTATTSVGPGDDGALGVAIQGDAKIVAAGFSFNGANHEFALVRYQGDQPGPPPPPSGAQIIAGPGSGGGGRVKVFSGSSGAELRSFLAYGPGFTGGVRVASGDVTGDGIPD